MLEPSPWNGKAIVSSVDLITLPAFLFGNPVGLMVGMSDTCSDRETGLPPTSTGWNKLGRTRQHRGAQTSTARCGLEVYFPVGARAGRGAAEDPRASPVRPLNRYQLQFRRLGGR